MRTIRIDRRWKVLIVASAAVFMAFLDLTITNVAFPSIHRSFPSASLATLSWVLNAYGVTFGALLVPAGRCADMFGRRRLFLIGLLIFVAGSAASGIAPALGFLIAARTVQAVGAAIVLPAGLALVLPEFGDNERALATSLFVAAGAIAAAMGPVLGGIVVYVGGWRWTFFINVPIGAAALAVSKRLLRETRDRRRRVLPDAAGLGALVGGTGLLTLGIVESSSWNGARTGVATGFGCVLLAGFVARARSRPDAVLDLSFFGSRSFAIANLGLFLFTCAFSGLLLTNVLFLTRAWHFSPAALGAAITPAPLMAAVASAAAGKVCDRFDARLAAVPGALIFVAGTSLLALRIGPEPSYVDVFLPATLLTGTGVGVVYGALYGVVTQGLAPLDYATGTSIAVATRQLGSVAGVAVVLAIIGDNQSRHGLAPFRASLWLLTVLAVLVVAAASALGSRPSPGSPGPTAKETLSPEPEPSLNYGQQVDPD